MAPETRAPWWLPLALATASLIGTGYMSYAGNDKAISIDIATLKAERIGDANRLDRIEHKVDAGMTKLDEVLSQLRWSQGSARGGNSR